MKWWFSAVFIILSQTVFAAPQWIVLRGNIAARYNNTKVYIKRIPSSWKDSAVIMNGRFEFRKEFIAPCVYEVYTQQDAAPLEILVERTGIIYINAGTNGLQQATTKGSFAQTVYLQFLGERQKLLDEKKRAVQKAGGNTVNNKNQALRMESIPEIEDDITAPLALSYAMKYPGTFAAAYILENYGGNAAVTDIEKAYYHFSIPVQQSYVAQRLLERLAVLKSAGAGQTVADFSLMDASGKTIHFSDIKNKVVLIDFWASWCGPCREEFKLLRYLYEKHRDKGFVVISISVDISESSWKKALQQEQLPWLQLRDETTGVDVSAGRFGVTGLPTTFLLDRDRKILYRDLATGVLDKVIESLVNE